MSPLEYVGGLAAFAAMLGGVLFGAWRLQTRRLPHLTGSARAAAVGLLAAVGVLAVHLVPGIFGILGLATVLIATALWALAGTLVRAVALTPEPAPVVDGDAGDRLATALAGALVFILAAFTAAVAFNQLVVPPLGVDALSFHLPGVAAWIQSGSIWGIHVYLPDVSPGHYPNNGDVMLLAAVLPWRNDFLVHYAMYPFFLMTGVAVYALGVELRAPRSSAAVTACLVLAVPVVAVAALVSTLVDAVMLFTFATGVLFLARHRRTGLTAELALAGLSLGVAFGTKWYGVSAVACVVLVWVVSTAAADRSARRALTQGGALLGLIALTGGLWLLRNWIASGNPLYPVEVAPLGLEIFRAPPDPIRAEAGFSIANYIGDASVWLENILPQLRLAGAAPAAVLLAGLGLGGVLLVLARIRRHRLPLAQPVLAGLACAVLLLVTYAITPYTAGPRGILTAFDARYGVPALVVAAPILAWAAARVGPGAKVLAVLGALATADALSLMSGGQGSAPLLTPLDWAAGALVTAAVAFAIWAARRPGRSAAAVLASIALLGVALAGFLVQERYNARRYLTDDPAVTWLVRNAPAGERIGLTGLWSERGISPIYPAFGPRLANQVQYIGAPEQDTLRRYRDRASFTSALERGRYDFVIAGLGRAQREPEADWATAAGYAPVARSERLVLLKRAER